MTGQDFDVSLTDEDREKIPWIAEFCKSRTDKLAVVLLASAMVRFIDKDAIFYRSMFDQYRIQFPALHSKTVAKLEKVSIAVQDYFNGDVFDFIKRAPSDSGFVSYHPFSNSGKAYIRDFAKLESLFEYEPPSFTIFDQDRLVDFCQALLQKKFWLFGTNLRLHDAFEPYLCGMSKTTNRAIPVFVYSNTERRFYIGARQQTQSCLIPRLMPGDSVGDHIELKTLTNEAFQTLRSEYMNINIRPGAATLALGVLVDGKLIGVFAFSASPTLSNWDTHIDTPTIYLLSDFPVEPVDFDRLAKLVLYSALSKESQRIAQRLLRKKVFSLVTTAFSNNPVSMKYRGLFRILNRKEQDLTKVKWAKDIDPANAYYLQRYQINYGAPLGQWSLTEGLELWKNKHSQRGGRKEVE